MKAPFSITIMESYIRLKVISVVNEGAKVLDICTTLVGLPDLALGWFTSFCGTFVSFRMGCVNYARVITP